MTFFEQLVVPFMMLVPHRAFRIFAAVVEIFFQFMIVGTGNYAWINVIGMLPCIALFDDAALEWLAGLTPLALCRRRRKKSQSSSRDSQLEQLTEGGLEGDGSAPVRLSSGGGGSASGGRRSSRSTRGLLGSVFSLAILPFKTAYKFVYYAAITVLFVFMVYASRQVGAVFGCSNIVIARVRFLLGRTVVVSVGRSSVRFSRLPVGCSTSTFH